MCDSYLLLEWVIFPLPFARPNLYSILGSKPMAVFYEYCTHLPN